MRVYAEWAAARAGVTVRLYDGRMSHIKAMLVDGEALVVGSSNFDYLSFYTNQEVLAIVRDPEVIAQYQRDVLDPDLAAERRAGRRLLEPLADLRGAVAPGHRSRGGAGLPVAQEPAGRPGARGRGRAGEGRGRSY